jgi:hypothetical protein
MMDESIMIFKKENVKGIRAEWTFHSKYGDNRSNMSLGLKQFWDYYDNILQDPIRAAESTRLGKLAKDRGFSNIYVDPNFDREEVHVIFRP